jgi:2-polyprenyl-3-methyl-5-hydroxy-6-metoxy-1,4-benzoquinol methylase
MADRGRIGERPRIDRSCPCCGGKDFVVEFTYERLIPGETPFPFTHRPDYWREIHRCRTCGHFLEWHAFDTDDLYAGDYVSTTYGDEEGLRRAFERVLALPEERSDNAGRVARINRFAAEYFPRERRSNRVPALTLLDVGSGLCVFGARMREAGWDVTAVDLDPRLAEHAQHVAGVVGRVGDVSAAADRAPFDAITFNKVLEHVADPADLLRAARPLMTAGGFVYVEVPDGEAAVAEGREREEFLLGHRHVFSAASLALMVRNAGGRLLELERLREPSAKLTLRAFVG